MRRPVSESMPGSTNALIAEYVCGLLKPEEHAQVHGLLSRDDRALELALAWEETMLGLVDALPRVSPDPALRERLQRTLGIGPPPALQPPPQPQLLRQLSRETGPSPGAAVLAAATPAPAPAVPPQRKEPAFVAPLPEPPGASPDRMESARRVQGQDGRNAGAAAPPDAGKPAATMDNRAAPLQDDGAAESGAPRRPSSKRAAPRRAKWQHAPWKRAAKPTESEDGGSPAIGRPDRSLVRKLWLWRLVGLCATSAAIVGFMMPGEPPPPPVQIVKVAPTRAAILQAPGTTSTPGWTATLDPHGNLLMRPLVHTEVPAGRQALLWTRSAKIPEPRLLGRIDPNRAVQVPVAKLGALADDQLLEITLETDDDAARGVPNGPILFIGQMTVFGSESAAAHVEGGKDGAVGAPGPASGAGTASGPGSAAAAAGIVQGAAR